MKKWSRLIAIFSIGFLMGLAAMNLLHMHTLDRLYRIQNQLTNQLLDREIKLERLNESLQSEKTTFVKDLSINVEFEGSPLVKDEIEKVVHFYLADLVGKELWQVDGEMIYKILDDRMVDVENRQARLQVKYIVITEKISIGVRAQISEKL
ncbi:hypothetical protein SAMN05446037_101084 [Anaerovirgula multivorans]|uniref:Sporulation membrane protein YtrI C-terminal domain-containing protein n=1 Tax=Anaerovirgula multivorans TaxID=312168 RepID=A0A239EKG1_9FIRM|nr:hypothetical protein [Anaerovirgula multivorans]SNS45126.1 hypothetical protein SAMN05446037_101084 [Anaerovirgula multivorans]